jgi:uncharacterized membrane protein
MHDDRRSFLHETIACLQEVDHWPDAARAAIGGYAAAMFIWEVTHRAILPDFVLKNALPLDARLKLALLLLGGMAAALFLWLIAGWALARFRRQAAGPALRRVARLIFIAAPLPFVPLLAIPNADKNVSFLIFGVVVALATLVWIAGRGILAPAANEPPAAHAPVEHHPSPAQRHQTFARAGLVLTLLLTAGYILFMSVLTVARHNSFMTHAFDLGIQDQVVYNILHTGRMVTTLLGSGEERVYDHFSPIFYLVAPLYALFQDARILLVLQSVFLGIGAIPLFLLTRAKTSSATLACTLAVGYLLYPALHGVNLGDFHQIAFVSGLLLFALYFLEAGRHRLFLATLALALLAKEEIALSVAAIGIYILLAKRQPRLGLALTLFGLGYFAGVVGWLMPRLGSVESAEWRYATFILPGKGLLQSFAFNFITNPLYPLLFVASHPDKLAYLGQLFLPVLFLPLLAPAAAWITALPALLLPLLTVPEADYGIRFHYSAHITPFVFFLAALALQRIGSARLKPAALAVSLLVASIAMSYEYGQLISPTDRALPRANPRDATITSFFSEIPRQASVSALSDLVPHLSARRKIYLFPVVVDADYLLLDTAPQANYWPYTGLKARVKSIRDMLPHIQSGQFGLVRQEDGILLLRRGLTPPRTDEALRALFSARYEAETLGSDLDATVVSDPAATGGQARLATPASARADGKTALAFGPYTDLPPGKYRVEYALKTDRASQSEQVATIDVFTHKDGGVPRAAREILGSEFTSVNTYQLFELEFESDKPLADLEFRVSYAGQGALGFDYVQVTPVELWLK